jgi:tetratricopeptide (TPR) repeat protein
MTRHVKTPGECLADEILTDYLAGGLDPAIKIAAESHLIACDICRMKLAFFMRLLRDGVDEQEQVAIRAIEERGQSNRDRRLPSWRRSRRKFMMASSGVAAALLVTAGAWFTIDHTGEPRTASEVIHLILQKNRPFEARISGQPFLPYSFTRGESEATNSYSLLAGQMNRLAATTYEMGQFYLLQKDFTNAIMYLELASREPGATAEAHNDLGVAYMESGIGADEVKAIAEFRRALASKPDFLPAAFNLAIVYERLGKTDQAEAQWNQYMRLEPNGSWKDEAKAKLEGIKR